MKYRFKSPDFSTIGYVLFFIAIVENRFMEYKPVLMVLYVLRIIFAVKGYYLIFIHLKKTRRLLYPGLLLLQLLYSIVIIVSGVVNHNITLGIIYSIFIWIGITHYILNSSKTNSAFLRVIDSMFKLVAILTLALTILLPGVMITYSYDGTRIIEGFYGGKNALPMYLVTGLCLNLMVFESDGSRKLWRRFLYPLICIILLFASGSGTGSVIAIIFMILYYTKLYKFINTYNTMIIHTITIFSVVVFRLQERYLYPLIVDVLHRDITLTYRTDIWAIAIKYFSRNCFLGYGLGNNVIALNLALPGWYQFIINETHNGILDVALSLGILGLIPFLAFIFVIIRTYDNSENKSISQIMKLYLFIYFAGAISESAFTLSRLTFWSMLFIGLAVIDSNATGDIKTGLRAEIYE